MMQNMHQDYAILRSIEEICALGGVSLATGKHLQFDTLS
jgi:hypothetical protein